MITAGASRTSVTQYEFLYAITFNPSEFLAYSRNVFAGKYLESSAKSGSAKIFLSIPRIQIGKIPHIYLRGRYAEQSPKKRKSAT